MTAIPRRLTSSPHGKHFWPICSNKLLRSVQFIHLSLVAGPYHFIEIRILNRLQYFYTISYYLFIYYLFLDPIISWRQNIKSTTILVHHFVLFIHLSLFFRISRFIKYQIRSNTRLEFKLGTTYSFVVVLPNFSIHKISDSIEYKT